MDDDRSLVAISLSLDFVNLSLPRFRPLGQRR